MTPTLSLSEEIAIEGQSERALSAITAAMAPFEISARRRALVRALRLTESADAAVPIDDTQDVPAEAPAEVTPGARPGRKPGGAPPLWAVLLLQLRTKPDLTVEERAREIYGPEMDIRRARGSTHSLFDQLKKKKLARVTADGKWEAIL